MVRQIATRPDENRRWQRAITRKKRAARERATFDGATFTFGPTRCAAELSVEFGDSNSAAQPIMRFVESAQRQFRIAAQ